ncbi:MAG: DUF1127 domain-containing protein [Hyphomicrobiaceae bacterium]
MKATTFASSGAAASAADVASQSANWFVRTLGTAVARYRADAADRALRRELAGMDAFLLKDIGIAEDELWRIRRQHRFTPHAWR